MDEQLTKAMRRLEGFARKLQVDQSEAERDLNTMAGIIRKARLTSIRPLIEAGEVAEAMKRIEKL